MKGNYPRFAYFDVDAGNDPWVIICHGDRVVGWCYLSDYIEHLVAHPSEWKHPFRREGHWLTYDIINDEMASTNKLDGFGLDEDSYRHPTAIWKRFQNCATVADIING